MNDQLSLDFTPGDGSLDGRDREAGYHAWAAGHREANEARPGASPDGREESADAGFKKWQEEQRARRETYARRLGLPLGHPVEVVLRNGTSLRGMLALASPGRNAPRLPAGPAGEQAMRTRLPLLVGHTPVITGEIASCVRTD